MFPRSPAAWSVPSGPWILHSTPVLGTLTERWIDLQTRLGHRYESRLLGLRAAAGATRRPHWLLASDRPDLGLAYRGMYKSDGLTPVWVAAQFCRDKPSVVHVHFGPPAAQLVSFARCLQRPLVASFYGFDATRREYTHGRLWRRRYARLFGSAVACLAEGPRMAERVVALGCPEDKVKVVRIPADAEGLEGIERRRAPVFRAVIAGRFVEKKGFDTAIRAFGRAFRGETEVELLVIGGGPLENEYRKVARESGIEDRVTWGGRLEFDAFMATIATAHVALYPSRTASNGDSEGGAPVTLIEAQWLGVPSLISRHDDLEFVAGPTALALDPNSVDDWAQALQFLFSAPAKLEHMSATGRNFVREHHSPTANATAREEIYDTA